MWLPESHFKKNRPPHKPVMFPGDLPLLGLGIFVSQPARAEDCEGRRTMRKIGDGLMLTSLLLVFGHCLIAPQKMTVFCTISLWSQGVDMCDLLKCALGRLSVAIEKDWKGLQWTFCRGTTVWNFTFSKTNMAGNNHHFFLISQWSMYCFSVIAKWPPFASRNKTPRSCFVGHGPYC